MSRSSSRSYKTDRESGGSFCTTVENLMETSRSQDANESRNKETMKTDSDNRKSPNARRRHKSSSHKYIRRSPSRSPSSSRSRGSSHTTRSSQSRSSHALRSRSKNGRHTTHNKSGMSNKTRVISEQQILELDGIDMEFKSLSLKAENELSKRPKNGVIYDEVSANLRSIKKRLKHLSKNHRTFSIDEAIEISDATFLLKILRKPEHEIELAGQMAYKGALLMLQADLLKEKGRELLAQSKHKLRMADI